VLWLSKKEGSGGSFGSGEVKNEGRRGISGCSVKDSHGMCGILIVWDAYVEGS